MASKMPCFSISYVCSALIALIYLYSEREIIRERGCNCVIAAIVEAVPALPGRGVGFFTPIKAGGIFAIISVS